MERATAICNTFCIDSSLVLVPRHRREVSPLSRRVMLQPVSVPLQDGLRFFPPLYPHSHGQYGLTTFRKVDMDGLGALSPPVALRVHDRVLSRPCTRSSALLAQAWQHLWLVFFDDVYRAFTWVRHTIHPSPISVSVLTDTSAPRGCDASLATVGSLSEGSVQVVTFLHIFVGYC